MAAKRSGKMSYVGSARWVKIDDNGQVLDERMVDEFEKPVGRNERFEVTYLAEIINMIDSLGNKKMQVVKYILSHMCRANNTLIITTRQLAEECNMSATTVQDTLKILENSGLIKRKTGAIMLNPKMMNNWKAGKEATMMIKYHEFSESTEMPDVPNE